MADNCINTLGIEFESIIGYRDDINKYFKLGSSRNKYISRVVRDASVESPLRRFSDNVNMFMGSSVLRNQLANKYESTVAGYEVVTNPLELEDAKRAIAEVINLQVRSGEIFSNRSSIHVHVGFPYGFIFKKTATLLGLRVEPLFFKIAGMGNRFRGEDNNAAYCRPLALPPAVYLSDTKKYAILDPEGSIDAPDYPGFWSKFGIRDGDTERYNPLRYMGVNVFSTMLRGTMEYRFFNFCTVSRYVEAIASFCQGITELMVKAPLSTIRAIPQISIFKENSDSDYVSLLRELLQLMRRYDCEFTPDQDDVKSILDVIFETPQPVFTNKPVLSHITTPRISLSEAETFGLRLVDQAMPPGIVDIHTFNESDRRLICVS